jgi:hypothetical protein
LQEHPKGGKKKGKGKGKKIVVVATKNRTLTSIVSIVMLMATHKESCWKLHLELRPNWSKQQHKKKTLLDVEGDQRVDNNSDIEGKVTMYFNSKRGIALSSINPKEEKR